MIDEKLAMLNLPQEELKKVDKFLATLALVTIEELKDILAFLTENGVYLSKVREIKILANTKEELIKKFNIIKELGETSIYKQDPTRINYNVIDVYKKVQYCKQIGKAYKKEDGIYESFLFDESLWQQVANKNEEITPAFTPVEEDIVTLEPEIAPLEFREESELEDNHIDIQEYMATERIKEDEAKETTFDIIQDELEAQNLENEISKLSADKKELEDFQKQLSELDTISFNDLDFGTESFGGR